MLHAQIYVVHSFGHKRVLNRQMHVDPTWICAREYVISWELIQLKMVFFSLPIEIPQEHTSSLVDHNLCCWQAEREKQNEHKGKY